MRTDGSLKTQRTAQHWPIILSGSSWNAIYPPVIIPGVYSPPIHQPLKNFKYPVLVYNSGLQSDLTSQKNQPKNC